MKEAENSLRTIFAEALEIEDAQQLAAYLANACGADSALRRDVEELLRAQAAVGAFLPDRPGAGPTQAGLLNSLAATGRQAPETENAGDRIGRYKLMQRLGEGGCGVVYLAEQEEPVRRRVALKVIKVGMDTRQVIARFEAERQALALMDHPNIAKVLDAGATVTGRPYFVMELVRGVKITDYCDNKKLTARQRLELFMQVCQAVQHAHQKGIIHRDLKPSNILVTVNDGVAVSKVIDFGIAKATTGERLTDKTIFTAFEQFIGTPAYMSPEQAEITSVDIDTRSDIYSLGVLLYELLTGQTPFDGRKLLQARLEEMRRTLREEEPARPSTRLSTLAEEELTTAAQRRGLDAPELVSVLRGDLDWIVMRCLEKDRARRYETANGLAMDIQRHLNSEPVLACPPSGFYRFQKLARRNKLALATAGAVFLTLVIGLGVSTWSLSREHQARKLAVVAEQTTREEAIKAQQIARFLEDMLKSINPDVARGRDTSLLREVLDSTSARVARDLTNQPLVAAHLQNTIGHVYAAIGEFATAETLARSGLALRQKFLGEQAAEVAESLLNLSYAVWRQGRPAEAEALAREALSIGTKRLGREHLFVASALGLLGHVLQDSGKPGEAEGLFRESFAIRRNLLGNEDPIVAHALINFSGFLGIEGRFAEAENASLEAQAILKKASDPGDPAVSDLLYNRGNILFEQGRLAEAEAYFREALALRRERLGNNHDDTGVALSALASALRRQQKFSDAEPLYRECLALRERNIPNAWYTFYTRMLLGATLLGQKNYDQAEPLLLSGYEGMREREANIRDRQRVFSEALQNLAQLYEATGRPEKAEDCKIRLASVEAAKPGEQASSFGASRDATTQVQGGPSRQSSSDKAQAAVPVGPEPSAERTAESGKPSNPR